MSFYFISVFLSLFVLFVYTVFVIWTKNNTLFSMSFYNLVDVISSSKVRLEIKSVTNVVFFRALYHNFKNVFA